MNKAQGAFLTEAAMEVVTTPPICSMGYNISNVLRNFKRSRGAMVAYVFAMLCLGSI